MWAAARKRCVGCKQRDRSDPSTGFLLLHISRLRLSLPFRLLPLDVVDTSPAAAAGTLVDSYRVMNGLHDKRKAVGSPPLVRRPARSKPEAARRNKRAAEVPAHRIKRSREPAAPTTRRRRRRRPPPPPVAGDDPTTISYVLRNRLVVVPCTASPTVVSHYDETE